MKRNRVLKPFGLAVRVGLAAVLSLVFLSGAVDAREPTDFEQFMLELINRTREAPDAEVMRTMGSSEWASMSMPDLNEGLPPGTISNDSKQPLAFNMALIDAAGDYTDLLLANSAFEHQFGGMDPRQRMETAGYSFDPPWTWAENLAVTLSTDSLSITADEIDVLHTGMFADEDSPSRSRRLNMMNPDLREIGIGIGIRNDGGYTIGGQSYNAIMATQDFAVSAGSNAGGPFLTGVVYDDLVVDDFYTPGQNEGLSLTVVVLEPNTTNVIATTPTFASGGYTLGGLAVGTYDVRFVGGLFDQTFSGVDFTGSLNVKLDGVDLMARTPGDANGDHIVEAADYTLWANEFGLPDAWLSADFNDDNVVDAADYTTWANNFGQSPPGSPASAIVQSVPEPSAAILAVLAALMAVAPSLWRRCAVILRDLTSGSSVA